MEKGYFFSLEALISALIIISSIMVANYEVQTTSDKESKIYSAIAALEANEAIIGMTDSDLKARLEETLGFGIEVNPPSTNAPFIKYLIVGGVDKFKTIRIAYQQP